MNITNYLSWLIRQPAGSVEWKGTSRDLVELVSVVGEQREITDRRGYPLSQCKLASLAFSAVGMKPPAKLSAVVWQLRNRVFPVPPLEQRLQVQQAV